MKASTAIAVAAAAAAAASCAPAPEAPAAAQATAASTAETASAAALVQRKCSGCHTLQVATSGRRTAAQWGEVLELMVGHGMQATDEELRIMQAHLARPR